MYKQISQISKTSIFTTYSKRLHLEKHHLDVSFFREENLQSPVGFSGGMDGDIYSFELPIGSESDGTSFDQLRGLPCGYVKMVILMGFNGILWWF